MNSKTAIPTIFFLSASVLGFLIWQNSDRPNKLEDSVSATHNTRSRNDNQRTLDGRQSNRPNHRNPRETTPSHLSEKAARAALGEQFMEPDQRQAWLREMVKHDPEGAIRWVEQRQEGSERGEATRELALVWTETDLEAALAWLQNMPDLSRRQSAQSSICAQLANSDAPAALALAETLELGAQKSSLLENLAAQWVGRDADAALAWAKERSDPNERERVLGRVAAAVAQKSPLEAANLVASEMSDGPEGTSAIVSVVYHWAQQDPAAAAQWVSAFPEGNIGKEAAGNLAGLWAEKDFDAADEWVASLTDPSTYAAAKIALDQAEIRLATPAEAADKETTPAPAH